MRYRFDDLSWFDFESLCQSLLKAKLGLGIASWGGVGDHGRDASHRGHLPIPDASFTPKQREFVFQVKFVANANAAGAKPGTSLRSAVAREMARLTLTPDCYALMTNVPLTTALRDEIGGLISERLPQADVVLWGAKDVADFLDEFPVLRSIYPELLSIRDLQFLMLETIQKPNRERARVFLERAKEVLPTFSRTGVYEETVRRLERHHMAVLSGPPEMGKTTTALVIGLAKADEGWQCFEVRSPDEFFLLLDRDAKQVFVADDAFGTTEYSPRFAEVWSGALDGVVRSLDRRHWFLWTSRTVPLRNALKVMSLQGKAERFPEPGKITVNATALSVTEKALMLYRHARAANLTDVGKSVVKMHAARIVGNQRFTPKRVERFVREWLPSLRSTSDVSRLTAEIDRQIQQPTDGMSKSFLALPDSHKRLMVAFLDPGEDLADRFASINRGSTATSVKTILDDLNGQFLTVREVRGEIRLLAEVFQFDDDTASSIIWTHPSWRDLIIDYLGEAREERHQFLKTARLGGLELALSTGGGSSGKRSRPLLLDESDWAALDGRFSALVREASDDELGGIIATLSEALRQFAESDHEPQLLAWAQDALSVIRVRWSSLALSVAELRQYFTLSETLRPLPPGPDISETWSAHVRDCQLEINKLETYSDLRATRAWLQLADLIRENEPRFLRQVRFPSEYEGIAAQLFDALEGYFDGIPPQDGWEEHEAELDQFETNRDISTQLGRLMSDFADRSRALCVLADRQIKLVAKSQQRFEPPVSESMEAKQDRIPIERLFDDL